MEAATPDPAEEDAEPSRRMNSVSLILGALILLILGGTAWLRFGPVGSPEPPGIGAALPAVGLLDLQTLEAKVLLAVKGKVVWVVFWSARSRSGQSALPRLEHAWKRLSPHRCFTLVAAATDSGQPQLVREALGQVEGNLPAYLATPETVRRFGVGQADPPFHFLIDADGQIAATARGAGEDTISRLMAQARGWLDRLDPIGGTRFAAIPPSSVVTSRRLR